MSDWLQSTQQFVASIPTETKLILFGLAAVAFALWWASSTSLNTRRAAAIKARQTRDKQIQEETYQKATKAIEEKVLPNLLKLGVVVIEIIHDTDWDEFFREEARRNISFDEVFEAIRRLDASPKADVALILHTLGGYSLPSIMLADAVRKHRARGGSVTAFVPYVAMSGGTILALASDKVWMNPIARLGPIDTQFGEFSGDALRRLPDHKPADKQSDGVLLHRIEASKYEKYYDTELSRLIDKAEVDPSVFDGSLSHSHAFSRDDAFEYGVRVIPNERKRPTKRMEQMASLATKLVDERLRLIKNHWQKDELTDGHQAPDVKLESLAKTAAMWRG